MFHSNCLIEVIKAKIKNPKIKVTYISPFKNEVFCPHFMWSDGKCDYDFGINRYLKWYERVWFKGEIRKRDVGYNKMCKNRVEEFYQRNKK